MPSNGITWPRCFDPLPSLWTESPRRLSRGASALAVDSPRAAPGAPGSVLRCLLLQVRDPTDPMGPHEITSFRRVLSPFDVDVAIFDLLTRSLSARNLGDVDLVLMGGSGDYSATSRAPWLERALDSLRQVHASGVPAFASCWGFQGMAAAMGGEVIQDRSRAEVGTHELVLTPAGAADPVFGTLGSPFKAQLGHEDLVVKLPPRTTLLASSAMVANQAYRFDDAPIYCTQFHPELDTAGLYARFAAYPRYLEEVVGTSLQAVASRLEETPGANSLIRRFAGLHVGR